METQVFEERLKKLAAITGQDDHGDEWAEAYKTLLADVKADRDPARRYAHALRLRRLMDHQLGSVMNAWLQENRKQGMN